MVPSARGEPRDVTGAVFEDAVTSGKVGWRQHALPETIRESTKAVRGYSVLAACFWMASSA